MAMILGNAIVIVISYTKLRAQNEEQEKRIIHLESKTDAYSDSLNLVKNQLSEIMTDIKWIKLSLRNTKKDE